MDFLDAHQIARLEALKLAEKMCGKDVSASAFINLATALAGFILDGTTEQGETA